MRHPVSGPAAEPTIDAAYPTPPMAALLQGSEDESMSYQRMLFTLAAASALLHACNQPKAKSVQSIPLSGQGGSVGSSGGASGGASSGGSAADSTGGSTGGGASGVSSGGMSGGTNSGTSNGTTNGTTAGGTTAGASSAGSSTSGTTGSSTGSTTSSQPRLMRIDGANRLYPADQVPPYAVSRALFDVMRDRFCVPIYTSANNLVCFTSERTSNTFLDSACSQPIVKKQLQPIACQLRQDNNFVQVPTGEFAPGMFGVAPIALPYQTTEVVSPTPREVFSLEMDYLARPVCRSRPAEGGYERLVPLPFDTFAELEQTFEPSRTGQTSEIVLRQGTHRIVGTHQGIAYLNDLHTICIEREGTCEPIASPLVRVYDNESCGGDQSLASFGDYSARVAVGPDGWQRVTATGLAFAYEAAPGPACESLGKAMRYTLGDIVAPMASQSVGVEAAPHINRRSKRVDGVEVARDYYYKNGASDPEGMCAEIVDAVGTRRCYVGVIGSGLDFADASCTQPIVFADPGSVGPVLFREFGESCGPALFELGAAVATGVGKYRIDIETGACVAADPSQHAFGLGAALSLGTLPALP